MTSLSFARPRHTLHPFGSARSNGTHGRWTALVALAAVLLVSGRSGPLLGAEAKRGETAKAAEPDFGPNVLIFDPSMTGIQSQIDAVFKRQESNQFGTQRYAYLFKPGQYNLDVQMGFYMQALGLGKSPDDVTIRGAVRSMAGWMQGNATCNFWRTIENLSVIPAGRRNVNVWAVSQGGALRRTHVKGDLHLWDGGWSSGGFMADCRIDGQVVSGSQQQWFSRNSQWGRWAGGVWNMVFVGDINPPDGNWPSKAYTVVDKTPVIREKPYLFLDKAGRYSVMVPSLVSKGAVGPTWAKGTHARHAPADRPLLPGARGQGQCRQHQCGTRPRQGPAAHSGRVSLGRGHPHHAAGHGGARAGIPDPGAAARHSGRRGFRRRWRNRGRADDRCGNAKFRHVVASRRAGQPHVACQDPDLPIRHLLPGGRRIGGFGRLHGHDPQQRRGGRQPSGSGGPITAPARAGTSTRTRTDCS